MSETEKLTAEMEADLRLGRNGGDEAKPLTSAEIDDLVETRRKGLFLPSEVRTELIDRLLVTADEANRRALAVHGLRFGPCICEYSGPSRIMVGCPVHYPDPGADAEGETA